MKRYSYYEPPDPGYCPDCKEMVIPELVDIGIGAYEYWGARGVHEDRRWVCPCCESELQEFCEDEDE